VITLQQIKYIDCFASIDRWAGKDPEAPWTVERMLFDMERCRIHGALVYSNLAKELQGKVDMYLVDGDHRYESALADIENGLLLVKPGGFILVHDVDKNRKMAEATESHPYPVYEAFKKVIDDTGFDWCILRFIRKHLGIIKVASGAHTTCSG